MVRRATTKKQRRRVKREKSIILIASEGNNKTETTYFKEFNELQKAYRVIPASGNSTDPGGIIRDAVRSYEKKELSHENGDLVFAVFDTDFGKEKQIWAAREIAKKNDVGLILSNPCFELWLLLHFRYTTHSYQRNSEVKQDLINRWPEYQKNLTSYHYLSDRYEVAIDNAKDLLDHHRSSGNQMLIEECNPSTNAYGLVELLLKGGDESIEEK